MARRRLPRKRGVDTGRMLRPKAVVLRDVALVPEHRSVKPPPNQFTHEVRRIQPYYYGPSHAAPDGEFSAGTLVVLMVYEDGEYCRVIDARGLYVETAYEGLRRL
jgi:hypothetical protein